MENKIDLREVYEFFIANDLMKAPYSENIYSTNKARKVLDYLGILYDYDSIRRYKQVYDSLGEKYGDVIQIITHKDMIGRKINNFQWVHTIIIPIRFNDGTHIPEGLIEELRKDFIQHFGGATRFSASGEYISKSHVQEDKVEIWDGFGTNEDYEKDKNFIQELAIKAGSKDYCNQEAVTFYESAKDIKILETLDMSEDIKKLSYQRLFSLKSMILLAAIVFSEYQDQNRIFVTNVGYSLGYKGI